MTRLSKPKGKAAKNTYSIPAFLPRAVTTGYHLTFLNRHMEHKILNSNRWVKFAVQKQPNDVRLI